VIENVISFSTAHQAVLANVVRYIIISR